MPLFEKAAVFTDIHFGARNNSLTHLEDCGEFVDWFIDLAKQQDCKTGLFLGDWHHNRSSLNLQTLTFSLRALEKLSAAFEKFYFIPGNHDLYYRDKRDIHGVEWAKHLPNIVMVNDWFNEGDVAIVPWLVGEDYKRLNSITAKYMFGHFELPHFKLNSLVAMPDHGTIQMEHVSGIEHVFSGHFHLRQTRDNVTYIGNAFPHNFADVGDDQRGAMILEWDKEPQFYSWDNQPLYIETTLSKLLNDPDNILKPKMSIKVLLDMDVTYEQSAEIKETLVDQYGIRELQLIQPSDVEHKEDTNQELISGSVDTIIVDQIASINSEAYNTSTLIDIYNAL